MLKLISSGLVFPFLMVTCTENMKEDLGVGVDASVSDSTNVTLPLPPTHSHTHTG